MKPKLLSIEADAKTVKGSAQGYLTAVQYLAPAREYSPKTVCSHSTGPCRRDCIFGTGRGVQTSVYNARMDRTRRYWEDPNYPSDIRREVEALCKRADRRGLVPCVRLNGTSDILWERRDPRLFEEFPDVRWYDYTKVTKRIGQVPDGYHLTLSWSDVDNLGTIRTKLSKAGLAVPFAGGFPDRWFGCPVVDGDATDLRFLDSRPWTVVGLAFKGKGGSRPAYRPGLFAVPGVSS